MVKSTMRFFKRIGAEEAGITALETAIILIAFVVVASVFAFTMLSAGTFSTERGKEAIYAGLTEVQSSMELKGGVIAIAASDWRQRNRRFSRLHRRQCPRRPACGPGYR